MMSTEHLPVSEGYFHCTHLTTNCHVVSRIARASSIVRTKRESNSEVVSTCTQGVGPIGIVEILHSEVTKRNGETYGGIFIE